MEGLGKGGRGWGEIDIMEGAKEWEFVLQGGICGMEDNVELGLIKKRGKEQRLGGTKRCLKGLEEVKTSGSGRIDRD